MHCPPGKTASAPPHALITGASSGIGTALSVALAGRGYELTLMGRDRARLASVAETCRAAGARTSCIVCDVRDAQAMETALGQADARSPLGLVVANAGVGGAGVLAKDGHEPAGLAREIVDVNLLGVINTVAPMQQPFIERRRGTFVLVSSMAAFEGLADAPAYAASKAAVRIYGHGLRRLLAPHGIRVSVLTPGFVATPMSSSLPLAPPFLWSAQRAVDRILRGLDRNEPEIAFPWQLRAGLALARMLPVRAVDFMMRRSRHRLEQRS